MARLRATKYLRNYLHWFEFVGTVVKDKTLEETRRDLGARSMLCEGGVRKINIF